MSHSALYYSNSGTKNPLVRADFCCLDFGAGLTVVVGLLVVGAVGRVTGGVRPAPVGVLRTRVAVQTRLHK